MFYELFIPVFFSFYAFFRCLMIQREYKISDDNSSK